MLYPPILIDFYVFMNISSLLLTFLFLETNDLQSKKTNVRFLYFLKLFQKKNKS